MFRSLMTIIRELFLYLTKVIFMLKHSVKLRRLYIYILYIYIYTFRYYDLSRRCGRRHLAAKVGTSKGGGKQWQTTPKNFSRMQCTRAIPVT